MEFPHLGKHCSEKSCNKLDFLPMKCDSCNSVFCSEHFSYSKHSCPSAHQKSVQVPVCPLCNDPVPTPRDVPPDLSVSEHIDRYCKSETKKIFTNRCNYKNCKKKELVPFKCSDCHINYCLKHRHITDHECQGAQVTQRNAAANAAEQRKTRPSGFNGVFKTATNVTSNPKSINSSNNNTPSNAGSLAQNIQGSMTEDEALAHAMALSIMELDEQANRERLARQQDPVPVTQPSKDKCSLS
ncbi:AN1-type zinc finger protein 2A [Condylostylus longicornis]|uniref:AN1-type zinc finger protein 2A n=1 Tax=Condylostylus longicornis TaxID=2530218 RepID=UPI00244DFF8E|nr:AN1-type zinc finger protein 2A [Condylostylus longicornis]